MDLQFNNLSIKFEIFLLNTNYLAGILFLRKPQRSFFYSSQFFFATSSSVGFNFSVKIIAKLAPYNLSIHSQTWDTNYYPILTRTLFLRASHL
ncbi:hypothetical protein A6769_04570 [Nostoc punctiforme NIES-2108]|uniref:Uncharacterized protein n=1 Tax=Nostoc punctiforme NIES-2108 TaxID=1356359 RepID=A0A367RTB6_NOSPU|nr:hypothetical protein A6769_04570 [Nostoc punctiforme NIES-2108]